MHHVRKHKGARQIPYGQPQKPELCGVPNAQRHDLRREVSCDGGVPHRDHPGLNLHQSPRAGDRCPASQPGYQLRAPQGQGFVYS